MVIIVGGGISGLATAYYLSKADIPVTLIERAPRLGGVIHTIESEGCTIEEGADGFLTAKPWARELIDEIGLGPEIIGSNDSHRATYIWKGNRLVPMPEGLKLMVPTRLWPVLRSNLIGWSGKCKMLMEFFRRARPTLPDRSVSEFVEDHFGRDAADYLAEPLLAGVYGGDPKQLSAEAILPQFVEWEQRTGSLIRAATSQPSAAAPIFSSLARGMRSFIERLAERARMQVIRGAVTKIERGWRVRVNGEWLAASQLVIACRPSLVLPDLFPDLPYSSSTVVARIYRRKDVAHPLNGFGFLVPMRERKSIAACTWVGTKYPQRVPENKAVLRCFTNGNTGGIAQELREKMGVQADPIAEHTTNWPESMPQYLVGHKQRIQVIHEMLMDLRGLHLTGNGYNGVGIPDCVRMGKEVAAKIVTERMGCRGQ